jgi:hypothetical protein
LRPVPPTPPVAHPLRHAPTPPAGWPSSGRR